MPRSWRCALPCRCHGDQHEVWQTARCAIWPPRRVAIAAGWPESPRAAQWAGEDERVYLRAAAGDRRRRADAGGAWLARYHGAWAGDVTQIFARGGFLGREPANRAPVGPACGSPDPVFLPFSYPARRSHRGGAGLERFAAPGFGAGFGRAGRPDGLSPECSIGTAFWPQNCLQRGGQPALPAAIFVAERAHVPAGPHDRLYRLGSGGHAVAHPCRQNPSAVLDGDCVGNNFGTRVVLHCDGADRHFRFGVAYLEPWLSGDTAHSRWNRGRLPNHQATIRDFAAGLLSGLTQLARHDQRHGDSPSPMHVDGIVVWP